MQILTRPKNKNLLNFITFASIISLTSCLTQPIAPIEYNNEIAKSSINQQSLKFDDSTASNELTSTQEPLNTDNDNSEILNNKELLTNKQISHTSLNTAELETVIFQPNMTIEQIAKEYNVTAQAILVANKLRNPSELQPGRRLTIPLLTMHIVKEYETLEIIAEDFAQNTDNLIFMNSLIPPYKLYDGQKLVILMAPREGYQPQSKSQQQVVPQTVTPNIINKSALMQKNSVATLSRPAIKYILPINGVILHKFGQASGIEREGIVFSAAANTPVKACADGIIFALGHKPESYGNFVIIKHPDNSFSAYAHLSDSSYNNQLAKNKLIKQGDIVGLVGKTGKTEDNSLYFALKINNKPVDPINYLDKP